MSHCLNFLSHILKNVGKGLRGWKKFVILQHETVGREMPDSKPFITPMVFLCPYRSDAILDFHSSFLLYSNG